jgi:hypothetical protein
LRRAILLAYRSFFARSSNGCVGAVRILMGRHDCRVWGVPVGALQTGQVILFYYTISLRL